MEYIEKLLDMKLRDNSKEHVEKRREFIRATKRDDSLAVVLKAHLYIEKALEELLEHGIKNFEVLGLKYFREKLNLCYAVGLIDKDLYVALKKFNTIRNNYGHRVEFEINEGDFKEIYDLLNDTQQFEYKEDIKLELLVEEESFNLRIRVLLASLYSEVVIACQLVDNTIAENFIEWQSKVLDQYKKILEKE